LNVWHVPLESLQTGHFLYAGGTPAGPEVQHDHFALKTLQIDGVLAVVDGKRRGYSADLVGKSASIAACRYRAGEKD
jgi:hypothetical protein